MSNKQKYKKNHTKNGDCHFDFSTLLTYCDDAEKEKFNEHLNDTPVSSLLRNERIITKEDFESLFTDLRRDENDSLLYRFDKQEDRLGKTIEHFGGCFYILDPSSAKISFYLEKLLKNDFVAIDLCAAPGGKTIALNLRRRDGLFLSNDMSYDRALEIDKNVQRMQMDNVLTLSMDPMNLRCGTLFDLVIADVPCSGSGMIRKEKKMKNDWSIEKVERLLPIQENLLEKAYEITLPDGIIAYSTCSFSKEEDEEQVEKFLKKHTDCHLIPIDMDEGMIKGSADIGYHMIPGIYDGEGIYFALIRKEGGDKKERHPMLKLKEKNGLKVFPYKNNFYHVSRMYEEFSSLPFIAPGIKELDMSEHKKCDFDHAYSKIENGIPQLELNRDQTSEYIQGNEIRIASFSDGLYVITYKKMRLGFGKLVQGRLKNYLPKGLRGYYQ